MKTLHYPENPKLHKDLIYKKDSLKNLYNSHTVQGFKTEVCKSFFIFFLLGIELSGKLGSYENT